MSNSSTSLIVVIGGGISGLTAAYRLKQTGHEVIVLDRRDAPGGRVVSESREGFLVEQGPNSMISPAPGAETLIDTLDLTGERIDKSNSVRHRYLVRDGQTHALPIDPLGFFSSGFFSLPGRLRLLFEPFVPRKWEDESVADFIRRRFGSELLDYVFDPLVGGLYAGDPEKLSVSALLPKLKQLETRYGSVVQGAAIKMFSGRDARYDPRRRMLFSFRHGMATLPRQLGSALGSSLRSGVRVEHLFPLSGGGYQLQCRIDQRTENLRASQIVLALPAYAAARLLESFSPDTSAALAAIEHPPLAVVGLGFHRRDIAHPLDGLGVLIPRVERRNVLGFLFSSTLFTGRAPDDHVLLTAYVGGARQPGLAQLPRTELIDKVRSEAADLLGCRGEPVFDSVHIWRHGLPQPGLGHANCLKNLHKLEQEFPGLALTGNYVAGVSTSTCIDTAIAAADRVVLHCPHSNGLTEEVKEQGARGDSIATNIVKTDTRFKMEF